MPADLDARLTHVCVLVDDLLPRRRQRGRPVRISDSELICLAIAQVLLDCPNERRFLRLAKRRLGHLFPYFPGLAGLVSRVARRLLALAAAILHNWSIGEPGRSLVAYDAWIHRVVGSWRACWWPSGRAALSQARPDASARQRSPEPPTRVAARARSDRAPTRVGSGLTETSRIRHTQHTVDPG